MEKSDTSYGQCDNSLLIELVKSVAVLTSKFDAFEKVRSEDNVELKDAIKNVDDKVEKLDAKFEARQEAHQKDIEGLRTSVTELQKAPLQDKAAKWESYTKLILELVITVSIGVILVKIGLK